MKLKSNGNNHNVKGIPLVVTYHPLLKSLRAIILREMCPNTKLFLVRIFPYFSVFSPNTGKYGPEITPYLDNFHAVY